MWVKAAQTCTYGWTCTCKIRARQLNCNKLCSLTHTHTSRRLNPESRTSWWSRKTSAMYKMGWDNMISTVAREGSLKLMACDGQLLAQICCSHLFCLAGLKCSHFDGNRNFKRSRTRRDLLTLRFVEPTGKSLQLAGANSLQQHSQWLKRFAERSAVKLLWHASRSWINDSGRSNLGLINADLHLEKVMCHCSKINWLFANGLFLRYDINLLHMGGWSQGLFL